MAADFQEVLSAIAVLHARRRDNDGQDQPEGIDEDVPLAAFDLLVRVKPADPLSR